MEQLWNRMRTGAWFVGLAALVSVAGQMSPVALAEDAAQPVRAVRLSSVDGQVLISQGSQLITDQAVANAPLFEGMRVATGEDGRAEIQFEDGSVARLSPNSSLTLAVLRGQGDTGNTEIELGSGLGYFEVQAGGQAGAIRVRFGDTVVTAGGFTVLRINIDNPPGELAVFSGNAHLERGKNLTVDLHGGESVALSGDDTSRYTLSESIEPDSWDSWNSDRDQMLTSEAAAKTAATNDYASNSNPAWNDLDANGSWYNLPGQGNIWSPFAAASSGWDPYGNGYWMWTPRFGYIWVSGYSWGYLPFQCGSWNYYDSFGWGWMPGMGGCSPWWGDGGYYAPNIGIGYGGYHPPLPPHMHPHLPIGRGGHNPMPLIAVNRHPSGGNKALPARDGKAPVVIAGQAVQPVRQLNPRPQFERSASSFVNRTPYSGSNPGAASGTRTAGAPAIPAGPSFGFSRATGPGNSTGSSSGRTSGGGSHGSSGAASSGGGSASHGSSGGYSGGSAGHSSGGGGSSGGGSSGGGHSSGGGGSAPSSSGGGSHR